MQDTEIQVPADLEVKGTSAPITPEPLAQPDQNAPSTGTEQPPDSPDAAESAPAEEASPEPPEQPAEEAPKKSPWFVERDKRRQATIADLNRQLQEERAERERLLQSRQTDHPQQQDGKRLYTEEEARMLAREEALNYAQQQQYQEKVHKTISAGNAEYPDFADKSNIVASLVDQQQLPHLMATVTSMDDGHKVIAYLADHPDKAIEILNLPPIPMAVALARLSSQEKAKPPPVTKAPAPVRPVGGATTTNRPDAELSDAEWAAKYPEGKGVKPKKV